ncbi:MAG: hypothetical protein SOZ22_03630 [Ezakiella sp.]|nr:hypothetical protein [Bacillota bacterium]MDY3923421.1 hypothetical protein [Ezakiella sp.]
MSQLMDKYSVENMLKAHVKVKANKDAGGIDEISTEEIDLYL